MSKKQRVKGKGADIFFSEEQEEAKEASEQRSEDLVKKATFYFTQSQLDALEKAVFLLKQEHRIKTNKSEVMREALSMFTADFLQNGSDSKLYEKLVSKK